MSVVECIIQCRAVLNTILKETPANDATKQTVLKNKINLCTAAIADAKEREWVGLTDDEIQEASESRTGCEKYAWVERVIRNAEAKLKEKNHA
jgi:hypothetical protein